MFTFPNPITSCRISPIFVVLFFLFSFHDIAFGIGFEGVWKGTGVIGSSIEGSLSADPVIFELTQQGTSVSSKDCWNFKKDGIPWRFCSFSDLIFENSVIFYKGQEIGTYSPNQIKIQYWNGSAEIRALVEIQNNGSLNFQYFSKDASGKFYFRKAKGLTQSSQRALFQTRDKSVN